MEQMANPTPAGTAASDNGSSAKIIYILYLVSLVIGVTAIVGLVMAYVNQGQGPAWVQTHYRFQIRTFWILILASAVALLLTFAIIGVVLWPLILIWLIVRCVKGLMAVEKQQPYANPASWIW
ncbi:MAG TPA: hypothetical protein VMU15_14750 [Anaeromyxobacter sp.]|nr:hypothetical protein [Anaeromyxobacter sp.]